MHYKEIFKEIKPPFRYDYMGQSIWDSENNMVLDIRGWGFLQYIENGEKYQDGFGLMITEVLNTIHDSGGVISKEVIYDVLGSNYSGETTKKLIEDMEKKQDETNKSTI